MAISTYAELQTAVAGWLHRSDLTARVPEFIAIGESRLNADLALTGMEQFGALTASTSSRFVALPTRFNKPLSLVLTVSGSQRELNPIAASKMAAIANTLSSAQPNYYAIGSQIQFECTPDQAYALTLHYIQSLDIAADSTNFLLSAAPDCYLNAAMAAACVYTGNDQGLQKYEALTDASIDRIKNKDGRTRFIARLGVDAAIVGASRNRILTDG